MILSPPARSLRSPQGYLIQFSLISSRDINLALSLGPLNRGLFNI